MGLLTPRWKPLRPHPIQHAYWTSPHRFNVVSAGRRSGKTELAKRKLIKHAIRGTSFDGARFFAAAPTLDQTRRIYWADLKAMVPQWCLADKPSETKLIIPLINGTEIHVLGMDKPERIEGSPWDGGILDEYGNMKEGAWGANVRPALADRNGWCDLIGVPEGMNHYRDMDEKARAEVALRGDKAEFGSFTWFSSDILPAEEIEAARRDLHPKMFQQEYEGSFVDWSGTALFEKEKFLIEGQPVPWPTKCDYVFATVDTAVKSGKEHDGSGVTFWARNQHYGIPLIVLDWDLVQFDGDILNVWLKNIIAELERMARVCGARRGSVGVFIEDKQTGTILIQQAARQSPPWPVRAIDSDLTAQGKDERAISVLNYAYRGDIKISDVAHSKIVVFKENSRNHWESQVFGFKVGAKDGQADDLLDTFTYGAAISLGDSEGH